MPPPDPLLLEPHMSNRVLRPVIRAYDQSLGADHVDAALQAAGLSRSWFDDPEAWVSESFHRAFAEALRGGPLPGRDDPFWQPYRDAGRQTLERDRVGAVWPVLRAFASPRMVFKSIGGLAGRANAHLELTSLKATSRRARIEATRLCWDPAMGPAICHNVIGVLEAIPTIWDLPAAQVEHVACMHDAQAPADRCVYEVTYWERSSQTRARALAVAIIVGAVAATGAALAGWSPAVWLLAGGLFGGLLESWRRAHELRHHHAEDATRFADLLAGADDRYRALWVEGVALRRAILTNEKLAPYLPEDLVRKLNRESALPTLGGEQRLVTILFSDLAGYSSLSEHLDPSQVVSLLNDYFGAMTDLVEDHGGAVLDYIGDGLMAVFGAPEDHADDAGAAARCALAMQAGLETLNAQWTASGLSRAWRDGPVPTIACRIGLHRDRVVAGNIGSHHRMKYGVVGDGVNVAARLEGLNKALGTRVLLSKDVADALPALLRARARPLGAHSLKGREQQVDVLTLDPETPGN